VNPQSPVLFAFCVLGIWAALERARVVGRPLPVRQRVSAHVLLRLMRVAQWVDKRWGR
jgi:hypothetical protein